MKGTVWLKIIVTSNCKLVYLCLVILYFVFMWIVLFIYYYWYIKLNRLFICIFFPFPLSKNPKTKVYESFIVPS